MCWPDTEHTETHYSCTTLGVQAIPNLHIHTLSHGNDNGVNERQKEKVRELGDFYCDTEADGLFSRRTEPNEPWRVHLQFPTHKTATSKMLLTSQHTHIKKKKKLNLRKPVATWLELRNVAASAAVIQQGGMGIVREREKWEAGRQWSKKSDWSIRANNYNNKTVKMQSSP